MSARAAISVLLAQCAAGVAGVIEARADEPPPRAHLIYIREPGAERCPDEPKVRAAVAARLGYNPFSLQAPRTVTVVVRGEGRGLLAKIELSDALGDVNGNRRLTSPRMDCEELASALELAVALAIDPLSALHGDAPPAPPPAPVESPPDTPTFVPPPVELGPPPPSPPSPPPPAPAGEPTRIRGGLGALLSLGTAPSIASAGFALQVGFRQTAWSFGIEARGDLPGGVTDENGRFSAWLAAGWLVPCLHFPIRPMGARMLEAAGCALVGGGVHFGSSEGTLEDRTVNAPYVAGGLRAALEVPVGKRFALGVHADLVVPILRLQLQLTNMSETITRTEWSAPSVSGALGAMFFYYFR